MTYSAATLKTLSAPVEPSLVDGQAQIYPAVVQTLKDLDNSYLAVQEKGPAGHRKDLRRFACDPRAH